MGSPLMGVKQGCGKAMVEVVKVMIGCHSGRNMMVEWQVLQHDGERGICSST